MADNFASDAEYGENFERIIAEQLSDKFEVAFHPKGKHPDYDLRLTDRESGEITLVEVKSDRQTITSGCVYVELYNETKGGTRKPAGLSATLADVYIQCFYLNPKVYGITVPALEQLVGKFEPLEYTGDGNSCGVLIPLDEFIANSELLFNRDVSDEKRKLDLLITKIREGLRD